MTEIFFDWSDKSQKHWNDLLARAQRAAFQQDWAYGAVLSSARVRVSRLVVFDQERPIAMAQIIIRSFWGMFEVALLTRGPLWLEDLSPEIKQDIFHEIGKHFPRRQRKFLFFTPEEYEAEFFVNDQHIRQVITGYSTIMLDLSQGEEALWAALYSKNRNMIRKARKNSVEIFMGDHTHPYTDWLLQKEKKQQKDKKYQGLPVNLVTAYGEKNCLKRAVLTVFAFVADETAPVAGALFLLHGNNATYHIGWNGKEGRKVNALNLILWRGMCELKEQRVQKLDLGGLNTDVAPDIARFKLGFGGQVKPLIGTFL